MRRSYAAARVVRLVVIALVGSWMLIALYLLDGEAGAGAGIDGGSDNGGMGVSGPGAARVTRNRRRPLGAVVSEGVETGAMEPFAALRHNKLERLRIDPRSDGQRLRGGAVFNKEQKAGNNVRQEAVEALQEFKQGISHDLHAAESKVEELAKQAMRKAEDIVVGNTHGQGDGIEKVKSKHDKHAATEHAKNNDSNAASASASTKIPNAARTLVGFSPGEDHRAEESALARVGHAHLVAATPSKQSVRKHAGSNPDPWTASDDPSESIDMRRLAWTLPFDNPDGGAWKQGWDVRAQPLDPNKPLRVFVVPHSHCDPGWIKTFDEYFRQQTNGILTSVYESLQKDNRRTFVWAEISYFEWWWHDQSKQVQENMRNLIRQKRFEFVTGGWVQPDEANTERYAIEVQLQEGRDWIKETFGKDALPEYGWSIDPFGYSPTMADVLKEYGFRGMLIQRVHYAVKKDLAKKKHLEFMWRQTWDKAGTRDMFTHVMPFYSYDVPHTCGPDPSVCCQFDFARLNHGFGGCPWRKPPQVITDHNVEERAMLLLDQYRKKAALYRGNSVLVPLGDDFRYGDVNQAEAQFVNYQKIFDYVNANVPGAEVKFGTLSEYFRSIEGTFAPPVLKGSFFTYADRNEDYWSGYYTSRVFDKALDRTLERVLYAAAARGATRTEMRVPRRALSLFQHHDGVTGTAKDHVVLDYARRMQEAIETVQGWMLDDIRARSVPGLSHDVGPCWKADGPRELGRDTCDPSKPVYMYNPLETEQTCGDMVVPGLATVEGRLPCETAGPAERGASVESGEIRFDPVTGMMVHPVKEEWMVWNVKEGGAYLFFPDKLQSYDISGIKVERGGYLVSTPKWKRKVVERSIPDGFGNKNAVTVVDFVFETLLKQDNREWFVRLSVPGLSNGGVFHTDLNGFNFDTHHFRSDLPIQSQVFPMPTLASVEDSATRLTVLSEHAQGTASLREGSIDVFLDRRLGQDDNRGLGQGVRDNVRTRTRLRVLVETEGFSAGGVGDEGEKEPEFEITPLCKRFWDELNHPLEIFGTRGIELRAGGQVSATAAGGENRQNNDGPIVPFVYMVHKRVNYFKRAIDSLRRSDFPRSRVPLIVSHDGHVPEMMSFVEGLKDEFNIVQLFHPFACFDHPDSFPGADKSLNVNYAGDVYGNPRSDWATCAKHHWTWMMRMVWNMDLGVHGGVDAMFFMEEDYVVAPNIYDTVVTGLNLAKDTEFFGITVDITNGGVEKEETEEGWVEGNFRTGPMAIWRKTWEKIRSARDFFCTYDEYNWDWTLVKMIRGGLVPHRILSPSVKRVQHIGADGMHVNHNAKDALNKLMGESAGADIRFKQFHGEAVVPRKNRQVNGKIKPNGGWGHPKDHSHCLEVLGDGVGIGASVRKLFQNIKS